MSSLKLNTCHFSENHGHKPTGLSDRACQGAWKVSNKRTTVDKCFVTNIQSPGLKGESPTKTNHDLISTQKGLFDFMERAKSEHSVTDYSVSQTTLDDVFISFAKKQGDNKTANESQPRETSF